jgi:DNA-binding IclR family transcriptional regulator
VASAGLAILSYLPEREVEQHLRTDLVPHFGEAHSAAAVRERVARTRRTGYAINPGLIVEGSWGLGAAVFDSAGEPRWALTLTGIEQRFTARRRREMGTLLLREAHELSQTLRHR